FRDGLIRYDGKRLKQYVQSSDLPDAPPAGLQISDVLVASDGLIWLSSLDRGVLQFDPSNGRTTVLPPTLVDTRVNGLAEDENGNIWVASNAGGVQLLRMGEGGWESGRYLLADGLPDESIQQIVRDRQGNMWISTLKGLCKYDFRQMQFFSYNERNGLRESFLMDRVLTVLSDGRMLLGQNNGFHYWRPETWLRNEESPTLRFTDFRIYESPLRFERDLNHMKEIRLNHKENFFTIGFVALNMSQPYKNTYAYRLLGVDQNWRYTTAAKNYAPYTQLDPGEYEFQVRAANNDGVWNEAGISMQISIQPPWWKTLWFQLLMYLVIAALLYSLYRYRIRQIRKEEALKTAFNKKLAEVEMTALRAQMNPHFLFNSLNSIKLFVVQNEAQQASNYLSKFAKLIRLILNNSKSYLVSVQNELEMLELYLQLEKLRFKNNFNYEIIIEKGVNASVAQIPPMILQPYVENAIWHGLMHKTEGERKLTLRVAREGDQLRLEVTDNGIGRERARAAKSRSAMKKKSFGTAITKDRISLLNKLYQTAATVEILDLKDENGQASGTKVVLMLPFRDVN
ncbi:MAG: histidine kinase, partial [Bacteroidota bacterium]